MISTVTEVLAKLARLEDRAHELLAQYRASAFGSQARYDAIFALGNLHESLRVQADQLAHIMRQGERVIASWLRGMDAGDLGITPDDIDGARADLAEWNTRHDAITDLMQEIAQVTSNSADDAYSWALASAHNAVKAATHARYLRNDFDRLAQALITLFYVDNLSALRRELTKILALPFHAQTQQSRLSTRHYRAILAAQDILTSHGIYNGVNY